MITYLDDLIEGLKDKHIFDSIEVRVNGEDIDNIVFESNFVNIVTQPTPGQQEQIADLEDTVSELNNEIDDVKSVVEDIDLDMRTIGYAMEDYAKFHPEEWKVLNGLDEDTLIDFVKTVTNWYNNKRKVDDIC